MTSAASARRRGAGSGPGTWQLADDAAAASTLLRQRYPGVPLYILGESMGGAVAITAVTGTAGAPRPPSMASSSPRPRSGAARR